MPDALPAATILLYPGLGREPNMLACIHSGVVQLTWSHLEIACLCAHVMYPKHKADDIWPVLPPVPWLRPRSSAAVPPSASDVSAPGAAAATQLASSPALWTTHVHTSRTINSPTIHLLTTRYTHHASNWLLNNTTWYRGAQLELNSLSYDTEPQRKIYEREWKQNRISIEGQSPSLPQIYRSSVNTKTAITVPLLHTQPFYGPFLGLPGWAGARRNLLDFVVQWKITEADTSTIRLGATPTGLNIFTPDALPAATLPLYPGLGQAPNMVACTPSGFSTLVTVIYKLLHKTDL